LVSETQLVILLFLIMFLPALYLAGRRVQKGILPDLRPIPAFDVLRGVTARAIEAGRALHVSLGLGGITSDVTADSLTGLLVLEYLADQSAAAGVPPIVTLADPTLLPLAQDVTRRPYGVDREGAARAIRHVRWVAPEPAAYAASVMGILGSEGVDANVMVGTFGDEYLLMGEAANRRGITHVGGASDPNVLPFIFATADETLMGEDIYAAGAYLSDKSWHIGSLLAQDFMRWVIVTVIIVLVAVNTAL
jgi:hypothetical protein